MNELGLDMHLRWTDRTLSDVGEREERVEFSKERPESPTRSGKVNEQASRTVLLLSWIGLFDFGVECAR